MYITNIAFPVYCCIYHNNKYRSVPGPFRIWVAKTGKCEKNTIFGDKKRVAQQGRNVGGGLIHPAKCQNCTGMPLRFRTLYWPMREILRWRDSHEVDFPASRWAHCANMPLAGNMRPFRVGRISICARFIPNKKGFANPKKRRMPTYSWVFRLRGNADRAKSHFPPPGRGFHCRMRARFQSRVTQNGRNEENSTEISAILFEG